MKETVLLYNFTDKTRLLKVRQALMPLGFRIKLVEKKDYGMPIGVLAGVRGAEASEPAEKDVSSGLSAVVYDGPGFEDEMAVMAGFSSAQVDALIWALRKKGVGRIDYKAVLTPTNKDWDSVTLYHEIKKEHEIMSAKQDAVKKK